MCIFEALFISISITNENAYIQLLDKKCFFGNKFVYILGTADGEISVEDAESSGDFQIISEIWIEPQCGFSQLPVQSIATYMHLLQYHEIPDAVSICTLLCIIYLSI